MAKDTAVNSQHIVLQNIRSLAKNFDEFKIFIDTINQPLAVCLTETWLNDKKDEKIFHLKNFKQLIPASRKKRGGGVGILINETLKHEKINCLEINSLQILTVKIVLNQENCYLTCVYIPPNCVKEPTLLRLQEYLDKIVLGPTDKHIVCGDFNINFLKNTKNSKKLTELLQGNSLYLRNNKTATRETPNSKSLIDCFFSNFTTRTFVQKTTISDHYTVMCDLNFTVELESDIERTKIRTWHKMKDPQIFQQMNDYLFNKFSYLNFKAQHQSIENSFIELHQILTTCLDLYIPTKERKTPRTSWIDNQVKNAATKKRRLRQLTLKMPNRRDILEKYKKQNQVVKNMVRTKLRDYYQSKLDSSAMRTKKSFFNVYDEITGKEAKRSAVNSNLSAEDFNNFFANIGQKILDKFPKDVKCDLNCNPNSMFLWDISLEEVEDAIDNSKNKYSLDSFDINYVLLKTFNRVVSPVLTKLFNMCFDSETFPNCLKIAKVVPFFKEGCQNDPGNFRPISLLPVVGKLLERIIHSRLTTFIECSKLLKENQFGFRGNRNTIQAILTMVEEIKENFHVKDNVTKCTFLDLKKAFDTVDHNLLLQKCQRYGIRGKILEIVKSYLSDRKQFTFLNGQKSSRADVKCGVPQGSILGPLLFILYINDIEVFSKNSSTILYADDTVLKSCDNKEAIDEEHETEILKINAWLRRNKLTLNAKKTKTMLFTKLKKFQGKIFKICGEKIDQVNDFKYLGINIDNRLTFEKHINKVVSKLSSFSSIFYRLRKILTTHQLVRAFKTYVQPVVQYGVLIYGCTTSSLLNRVSLVIDRIIKIIFFKRKFDSVKEEREKSKIYSAQELHCYEILKLLINIIRGNCTNNLLLNWFNSIKTQENSSRRSKASILIGKKSKHKFALSVRLSKCLTVVRNYFPKIMTEGKNFTRVEANKFCHTFLENYILVNEEIVKNIFKN